jgi:hypothetical protein
MNVGFVYQILTLRELSFIQLVQAASFLDGDVKRALGNTLSFQLDPRSM